MNLLTYRNKFTEGEWLQLKSIVESRWKQEVPCLELCDHRKVVSAVQRWVWNGGLSTLADPSPWDIGEAILNKLDRTLYCVPYVQHVRKG